MRYKEIMIPKKIHFIWLGSRKPLYLKKFMKTFEKYAKGYQIRLWGDEDITKVNFPKTYSYIKEIKKYQDKKIKEYSDQTTMYKTDRTPYKYSKYAQISDLMRYEIVFNEGGYYFDANMFLIKDISKLLDRSEKFIGCNELGRDIKKSPILSNSFFGAIKNSPILKRLLTKKYLNSLNLKTLDVDFETGPGALRNAIQLTDNYYILPENTFYPYIQPWTMDGKDHPLRKSQKPKCTGPKKTKKRTLKMKNNLYLEFPCKQYKDSYGIKIWESGGSWTRPSKYYKKDKSKMITKYQSGGVIPACIPCAVGAAGAIANPIGLAVAGMGLTAYGAKKGIDYIRKKKKTEKKKKKKKN